jgi:adenylate cyclase
VERYGVGNLVVDVQAGVVTRGSRRIDLPPLTFKLLVALVRHAPDVVRREELLETVWPGEFVGDATLSQRVALLRRALGERSGQARYIGSARGWGYKIVPPVERIEVTGEPIRALAVLPLVNLSGHTDEDYFADGITEALITSLSKIRALKVISRTSSMCYRRTEKRPPQIACELGVQALVEGSVLRSGGRVWISAQLVRAATDQHMWAESYDRDAADVLTLLNELAATIAKEIRVVLSADEQKQFRQRRTVHPAAQEANLRGRYHLARWTPTDLDRAAAWFEDAARADPSFAEPLVGLAFAYLLRAVPFGSGMTAAAVRQLTTKSRDAVHRALSMDPSHAEGHAILGMVRLFHDWDWAGAEEALDRAIELDANSSTAHFYRALLASTVLDRDTVHHEAARAIELDPLNLGLRAEYAELCFWVRNYERALALARETLEFDPAFPRAHFILGRVHEAQGNIPGAIEAYERAAMLLADDATAARRAFARGGAAAFHRWALKAGLGGQTEAVSGTGSPAPPRPWFPAKFHARIGNNEDAISCLERAFDQHECLLVLLRAQEWWDPLQSDPRFADVVRRVGVPGASEPIRRPTRQSSIQQPRKGRRHVGTPMAGTGKTGAGAGARRQ